jgi:cell wall assembly regulator SMI1
MATETYDAPAGSPAVQGLAAICIDCHDPRLLGSFYARLLGSSWVVDEDGDAVVAGVHSYGGPNIDLLQVPEDKTVKNRVHLDLRAVDLDAAVAHAIDCGASLAPDVYDGDAWVVLRDPEGNEFCILRPYDGGELYWNPQSRRS